MNGFVVRVPATVANVGPGFDTLAFALDWHNEIHVTPASALAVEVEGHGAGDLPRDASNLVVRAMTRSLGKEPAADLRLVNEVPVGRGFGSSAAAIVGGLMAARRLAGDASDDGILEAAIEIEGHADNVSACLLGGVTVSLPGARTAILAPPPTLRAVIAVAAGTLATHAARAALPPQVSFADAATTAARVARLTAALAQGDVEALLPATDDALHQPARFALAPASGALVTRLREAGFAAFLSGAGPSVCALVGAERAEEAAQIAGGAGWEARVLRLAARGAEVVEQGPSGP